MAGKWGQLQVWLSLGDGSSPESYFLECAPKALRIVLSPGFYLAPLRDLHLKKCDASEVFCEPFLSQF